MPALIHWIATFATIATFGSFAHAFDSSPELRTRFSTSAPTEQTVQMKTTVFTVDTREPQNCLQLQQTLGSSHEEVTELCENNDPSKPLLSIFKIEPVTPLEQRYLEQDPLTLRPYYSFPLSDLHFENEVAEEIRKKTGYVALLGLGVFGTLAALPTSFTNWDEDVFSDMPTHWRKNIRSGPVMDKDSWVINFVGHPLSGAAYYGIARHAGAGIWGSFAYAVLMSTFYWEYGIEATTEVPSIQDLLITPIVGSIMGEAFYQADRMIEKNDDRLLGSKVLGKTARVFLDPAGSAVRGLEHLFERRFSKHLHAEANFEVYPESNDPRDRFDSYTERDGYYAGIRFNFWWK